VTDIPLSRAGSLPQGFIVVHRIWDRHNSNVGASLLAMTAAHSASMCLTYRYREQARSHRGFWFRGCLCVFIWMRYDRTFPTTFSGCSSDVGCLVWGCHWRLSDRVWELG